MYVEKRKVRRFGTWIRQKYGDRITNLEYETCIDRDKFAGIWINDVLLYETWFEEALKFEKKDPIIGTLLDRISIMPKDLFKIVSVSTLHGPDGWRREVFFYSKKLEAEVGNGMVLEYRFLNKKPDTKWIYSFDLLPYYSSEEMIKFLSCVDGVKKAWEKFQKDLKRWIQALREIPVNLG